eukprot:CAMPEP_0117662346 /NCGR_PEP_ID=MMETSP0804-20121206/8007_1 /TAXON_ID=1074897 /ORGANISM="Tetraselmis astigmatica, Strain CCMP880" /LENGTH=284 /DNA_ID=CAMNT_0005469245 /DNA_START=98 /DNA_END=952 /DNA_ORIENTATION=-
MAGVFALNRSCAASGSARQLSARPGRCPSARAPHRSLPVLRWANLAQTRTSNTRSLTVVAAALPPTVADTKDKFIRAYPRPIPALYNTVIQEFIVQSHLSRYNSNYKYDEVIALGFVSVFDQVTEGLSEEETKAIFKAYVEALGEDPAKYRADAEKMQELASSSGAEGLKADSSGNDLQKALASIAATEKYYYTKWFAIGLFRLLELAGATEPKALESLVKELGVSVESVNRDLLMYKGVLSKMTAARELLAEMMEREKKKQAERDAEKAAAKVNQAPAEPVSA